MRTSRPFVIMSSQSHFKHSDQSLQSFVTQLTAADISPAIRDFIKAQLRQLRGHWPGTIFPLGEGKSGKMFFSPYSFIHYAWMEITSPVKIMNKKICYSLLTVETIILPTAHAKGIFLNSYMKSLTHNLPSEKTQGCVGLEPTKIYRLLRHITLAVFTHSVFALLPGLDPLPKQQVPSLLPAVFSCPVLSYRHLLTQGAPPLRPVVQIACNGHQGPCVH